MKLSKNPDKIKTSEKGLFSVSTETNANKTIL